MAGQNGLQDGTWDSGSCFNMRWGVIKVPLTKVTPPKYDVKVDTIGKLGQMLGTTWTPGIAEVGMAQVELLASDYVTFVLPRMGKHGGTLVTWTVTGTITHPSIKGSYGQLWSVCRIVGNEGPEFDRTEKGLTKKLSIKVANLFERGDDNVWKCLSQIDLPLSDLEAAYTF